ncbi:MAG: hypothetical protein R3C04_07720 [Hyphomonas sp.]
MPCRPTCAGGSAARLPTGWMVTDTMLPVCRGPARLGLFAGSGISKSTFLGSLARGLEADHASSSP